MRRGRVIAALSATALVAAAITATTATSSAQPSTAAGADNTSYLVLTKKGADVDAVAASLTKQGATVRGINRQIGLITVSTKKTNFRTSGRAVSGVSGVAADRSIGKAPDRKVVKIERENLVTRGAKGQASAKKPKGPKADPLDGDLWGMRMIKADQAHKITLGNKKVTVGVMDTGVQGDHPDIAPNFDKSLSRNFTVDIPDVDGPCETANCVDPVGEDDNGHGTHVAGTIAGALNGYGVSGVAPKVDIVEVRAGQDSGYFFAGPTMNALTYSGDAGIDVVNMSFYVDPWLYNCVGGAPEDTPAQAADQEVIIEGMTRALDYAHGKGVTLVAAAGNNHEDMANPRVDESSPDYGEDPHSRTINNDSCYDLPVEGPHVLGTVALGPSGKKSDFSNYSTEPASGEIEFSAPGGWFRDGFGTETYRANENMILSSVPLVALQDTGEVDADGNITDLGVSTGVKKECQAKPAKGTTACGYFAFFQGTSMASPHAAGVAALAVSAHGKNGKAGFGLAPDKVKAIMASSATNHACPAGGVQEYLNEGRDASFHGASAPEASTSTASTATES